MSQHGHEHNPAYLLATKCRRFSWFGVDSLERTEELLGVMLQDISSLAQAVARLHESETCSRTFSSAAKELLALRSYAYDKREQRLYVLVESLGCLDLVNIELSKLIGPEKTYGSRAYLLEQLRDNLLQAQHKIGGHIIDSPSIQRARFSLLQAYTIIPLLHVEEDTNTSAVDGHLREIHLAVRASYEALAYENCVVACEFIELALQAVDAIVRLTTVEPSR
jgi:hypothetical protein